MGHSMLLSFLANSLDGRPLICPGGGDGILWLSYVDVYARTCQRRCQYAIQHRVLQENVLAASAHAQHGVLLRLVAADDVGVQSVGAPASGVHAARLLELCPFFNHSLVVGRGALPDLQNRGAYSDQKARTSSRS